MCNKFIFFMHFSSQDVLANICKIQNAGGTRARAFLLVIRRQAETHDMGRKKMVKV